METQKRQSIDLLNVLKYLMVLVFLAYIVFLVSRESADDVPVKTLQENVMKAGTEEVIKNIIEEFSLSDEEAEKYMKMYW